MKQSEEKKNGLDMKNPMEFAKSIRIEENLPLVKEMLELGSWKEIEQIRLYENEENAGTEYDADAGAFLVKFVGESENCIVTLRMEPRIPDRVSFQIEIK